MQGRVEEDVAHLMEAHMYGIKASVPGKVAIGPQLPSVAAQQNGKERNSQNKTRGSSEGGHGQSNKLHAHEMEASHQQI